jgi:hypothetical protein
MGVGGEMMKWNDVKILLSRRPLKLLQISTINNQKELHLARPNTKRFFSFLETVKPRKECDIQEGWE